MLVEVDGDIVKLRVVNLADAPLVVDRDSIVMSSDEGTFRRTRSTSAST